MLTTSRAPNSLGLAAPVVLSSLAVAAAALSLWRQGFVGLSNDDAARTLIAWSQSHTLTLDPTRSSWLPAHSWLLALALRLSPDLLASPRAVSLGSALIACGFTARTLRGTILARTLTLLGLALWPWSVLAAASGGIPEMPCVALVSLALSLLYSSESVLMAALAGLVLSLAEGHRYEAWWASAALVVAYALDRRALRPTVALGVCAALVPSLWIALNATLHGDPLDFVHRVEAFRLREGALPPLLDRALRHPWMLLCEAPGFTLLALLGFHHAWRFGRRDLAMRTLPPLAVVLALTLGELRGGGATHHAARSLLLPVWMLAPLVCEGLASRCAKRWQMILLASVLALQTRADLRSESAVEASTLRAGRLLRAKLSTTASPWLITLDRQDFLWIEALSAAPERALPDRAYGGDSPPREALRAWSQRAPVACVSTALAARTLMESGFFVFAREGGWTLLTR